MGARVIKIENPDKGDLCRHLYLSDTEIAGDSTLFHAINRGKESIALDLKSTDGLATAKKLLTKADVVIQNFRPGVMDRLGLGYDAVSSIKPDIIYGSISGYGGSGDWADLAGQDLLAQARSGIMWLSGNLHQGPVPIGLPIADISAGANLAQGLLGALFRHARTGRGALVETSLLESLLDLQFEFLTTYLNNGNVPPQRAEKGSAHGYLAAPYGIYETAEGYLALAMTPLGVLADLLELPELVQDVDNPMAAFQKKEQIYRSLQQIFLTRPAAFWEEDLGSQGVWCARVLNWQEMLAAQAPEVLSMLSDDRKEPGKGLEIVETPLRFDRIRRRCALPAPTLNEHGSTILRETGDD